MIKQTMQERRSVRKYKLEVPPQEVLLDLIETAITAPSASNHQPWRFLIIRDRHTINVLADLVQEAVKHIAVHIAPNYVEQFTRYGDYFTRFAEAPVLIVPTAKSLKVLSHLVDTDLDAAYAHNIEYMETSSGVVSTALAVQNLLLYAHELGLGASCMTGPLVALNTIRTALDLSDTWQVVCFIPLGYPDETPEAKPRKSAEAVIRWFDGAL